MKVASQVDVVLWSIEWSCDDNSDYLTRSLKFNNNNDDNDMSGYLAYKLTGDTTKTNAEIKFPRL